MFVSLYACVYDGDDDDDDGDGGGGSPHQPQHVHRHIPTYPTAPDTAGLARLDSRRPEARPFFAALFRHMQMVGARGLYQTAFEVGRFLLSLDPTCVETDGCWRWLCGCCVGLAWRDGRRTDLFSLSHPHTTPPQCHHPDRPQGRPHGRAAVSGLLRPPRGEGRAAPPPPGLGCESIHCVGCRLFVCLLAFGFCCLDWAGGFDFDFVDALIGWIAQIGSLDGLLHSSVPDPTFRSHHTTHTHACTQ